MPGILDISRAVNKGIASGIDFQIRIPQRMKDIAQREHNRICKQALRETMEFHHRVFLPRHFAHSAHSTYRYKDRKPSWIMYKQRRWGQGGMDLVATGKSKQRILGEKEITIGGAAEGGKKGLDGKLKVRFAFSEKVRQQQAEKYQARRMGRYSRQAARAREMPKADVTLADMKSEIRRMTAGEKQALAAKFRRVYLRLMNEYRSAREDKRLASSARRSVGRFAESLEFI